MSKNDNLIKLASECGVSAEDLKHMEKAEICKRISKALKLNVKEKRKVCNKKNMVYDTKQKVCRDSKKPKKSASPKSASPKSTSPKSVKLNKGDTVKITRGKTKGVSLVGKVGTVKEITQDKKYKVLFTDPPSKSPPSNNDKKTYLHRKMANTLKNGVLLFIKIVDSPTSEDEDDTKKISMEIKNIIDSDEDISLRSLIKLLIQKDVIEAEDKNKYKKFIKSEALKYINEKRSSDDSYSSSDEDESSDDDDTEDITKKMETVKLSSDDDDDTEDITKKMETVKLSSDDDDDTEDITKKMETVKLSSDDDDDTEDESSEDDFFKDDDIVDPSSEEEPEEDDFFKDDDIVDPSSEEQPEEPQSEDEPEEPQSEEPQSEDEPEEPQSEDEPEEPQSEEEPEEPQSEEEPEELNFFDDVEDDEEDDEEEDILEDDEEISIKDSTQLNSNDVEKLKNLIDSCLGLNVGI